MRKMIALMAACCLMAGCGTLDQAKIDKVKEVLAEAAVLAAPMADAYIQQQVTEGKVTQEQADLIKALLAKTLEKK